MDPRARYKTVQLLGKKKIEENLYDLKLYKNILHRIQAWSVKEKHGKVGLHQN